MNVGQGERADITPLLHAAPASSSEDERSPADDRNDLGNARRLVAEHGDDLRFVPGLDWHAWDGRRWRRDDDGEVRRRMTQVVERMGHEVLADRTLTGEERKRALAFVATSGNARRIAAAVELAAIESRVIARVETLDANPDFLTVANGTLDLRTARLRPHDRADLMTQAVDVAYEPEASCDRWQRFLSEVFAGDVELIAFIQRWAGYCVTGHTREHKLAVLHGGGANGKSTLVEQLKAVTGKLAATAAFDTFTRSTSDRGPRNDLARLRGARLVVASESGQGRALDEAVVKEITGGDVIAARFLYGEHFEYRPQFKLMLVSNHRPHVDGGDDAIRRRVLLVPFEESFAGREDRQLGERLAAERGGILAWAVRGAVDWYRHGLQPPRRVLKATRDYLADEDVLGAYLGDCCQPGGQAAVGEIRAAYEAWCARHGETPLSGKAFGQALARRPGIEARRNGRGRFYDGVSVVTHDASDATFGNSPPARARGALSESRVTTRHASPTARAA